MGSRYFEMQGWTEGAFVDWIRLNVVMMNPPGHTRLRKLVNRAFTPRAVGEMRVVSQQVASDLCDRIDANGGVVEFVHDWARVMPLRVVCQMIGIPFVDVDQMADWATGLTEASGVAGPDARDKGDAAMRAFNDYVSTMIAERKASPRDDLLTALINASVVLRDSRFIRTARAKESRSIFKSAMRSIFRAGRNRSHTSNPKTRAKKLTISKSRGSNMTFPIVHLLTA
jgi:cytochrome P450